MMFIATLGATPSMAQIGEGLVSEGQISENLASQQLLARIISLEEELASLRTAVQQSTQNAAIAREKADIAVATVTKVETKIVKVEKKAKSATYSGSESDAKWHLAGYADVGFVGSNNASGNDSFVTGKFNPGFHFQYKDLLMFESELEFVTNSDGETTTELEYSQINLFLNDYATLVVGKFLSPIGQFQERLHPSWINKIQGAPAGFGHDGLQPTSDTGIQLRGSLPVGETRLAYTLMMGNGPRLTSESAVDTEGTGRDDNSNKSFGGRLGYFPTPNIEIGGSFLTAKVNSYMDPAAGLPFVPTGPTDSRYKLWGVDGAYTKGAIAARFEYLNSTRASLFTVTDDEPLGEIVPTLDMEAWYGQISYRLSNVGGSDFIKRLEPVIRYGQFRINGQDELAEENAQNRFNIGLNYWLSPTIVTKAGLEWRNSIVAGVDSETRYQFQVSYGF
ncbi:MAG: hypothetical protein COB36_13435 [Alphaproteobacteria bacterium]|nr:MAG: hypothetical protein COB36_13435 [Alphaproteobacteria bacterium]